MRRTEITTLIPPLPEVVGHIVPVRNVHITTQMAFLKIKIKLLFPLMATVQVLGALPIADAHQQSEMPESSFLSFLPKMWPQTDFVYKNSSTEKKNIQGFIIQKEICFPQFYRPNSLQNHFSNPSNVQIQMSFRTEMNKSFTPILTDRQLCHRIRAFSSLCSSHQFPN